MKKSLVNLFAFILWFGGVITAHASLLQLDLRPIVINGYMDNTDCLRDKSKPCGPTLVREGSVDITFRSVTGYGYFTVRNWDTSHVKLEPMADFNNSEIIIRDNTGNPAYKIKLEGEFEITKKLIHIDQSQTWGWEDCGGNSNKQTLAEALRGVPMRCQNTNSRSHLSGFKVHYVIRGTLYRLSDADLRELNLPTGLKVTVNANGFSTVTGGKFDGSDSEVLFNGGKLRLNDRKCYINLADLKVNFGDLSPTSPEMLKSEKMTPIPLFCSGFATQIDGKDYQINGSGIRNVINGISIQAKTVADGNDKRIAVPDQDNLFVEVGPIQAGVCNAGSSVHVNGQKIETVGQSQVNGPVFNDQLGYQDGTPINLFWRLCQKKPSEPLTAGKLKDEVAATIRVHYN